MLLVWKLIRAHPVHTPVLYGTRGKVAKMPFPLGPSSEWYNLVGSLIQMGICPPRNF